MNPFWRAAWLRYHPHLAAVLRGARWGVEHTDCLVGLRALPDHSVDSCVTDPPAGIAFMGRSWDEDKGGRDKWIAWLESIMREVHRVLKPGAHVLVWALPRTSHWTALAVEDAGFEIRDCIEHVFGSGFPKSVALGEGRGSALKPATERWFVAKKRVEEVECLSTLRARLVELGLQLNPAGQSAVFGSAHEDAKRPSGAGASSVRTGMSPSAFEAGGCWSIVSSWLSILDECSELGSTSITATVSSLTTDLQTLNYLMSRITLEHMRQAETNPAGPMSLVSTAAELFDAVCSKCKAIRTHSAAERAASAVGSSLATQRESRPDGAERVAVSHDTWWLARKPLAGTLTATVERWGTGGLRIDDCRVAHASASDRAAHEAQVAAIKARGRSMEHSWKNSSDLSGASEVSDKGRWPANIVFSHHPDCKYIGLTEVPANPTWDTPNRATEPSQFTGNKVSKVRHVSPELQAALGRDDFEQREEEIRLEFGDDAVDALLLEELERVHGPEAARAASRSGEPSAERRYTDKGVTGFAALPGERRAAVEQVEQWRCVAGCPVSALGIQSGEDQDSAARYFAQFQPMPDDFVPFIYQAKPSSAERDAGLGHLRTLTGGEATGREDDSAGVNNPRAGAGRTGGRRNSHPTVKSRDLMRYLIRLVTPPGGLCLDPFTGSGSTGVACIDEKVRFLGFEMTDTDAEPFVRIARARIAHAVGFDPYASPVLSEDKKTGAQQLSLFALAGGPTLKP